MWDLIRRNKAVPVQARRVKPAPDAVQIHGPRPASAPIPLQPPHSGAAGGVTQNFFYVNVTAALPQSPAPPTPAAPLSADASPREVHYHTTHVYHAPRRPRLGRGTSFLGTLGIVLGALAAGAAYLQEAAWLAKPIAAGGFALAALGYLGALLLGRVGRGMPMLGMLACAGAYGLWLKNTGQPIAVPKIDLNLLAPQNTSPVNPAPAAPAPPAAPQDHRIFGDGMGGWTKPTDSTLPPPPNAVAPTASLTTATADLEKARQAAATRLGLDYPSAKSAADRADASYQQAQANNPLGSPDLIAASQQHLQAHSKLNAIQMKLKVDPAVAAAERVVNDLNRAGK